MAPDRSNIPPFRTSYAGADWLRNALRLKPEELSPLGVLVADILGSMFGGLYHLPHRTYERPDWSNPDYIEVLIDSRLASMATYDFNQLTRLVIMCHDQALRCGIQARTFNVLLLTFSPRQREGDQSHGHPTIEQAIASLRDRLARGEA